MDVTVGRENFFPFGVATFVVSWQWGFLFYGGREAWKAVGSATSPYARSQRLLTIDRVRCVWRYAYETKKRQPDVTFQVHGDICSFLASNV